MKKFGLFILLIGLILSLGGCKKDKPVDDDNSGLGTANTLQQALENTNKIANVAIDVKMIVDMAGSSVTTEMVTKVDGNISYVEMNVLGNDMKIYTVIEEKNKTAITYNFDGSKWTTKEIDYEDAQNTNFSIEGLEAEDFEFKDGKYISQSIDLKDLTGALGNLASNGSISLGELSMEIEIADELVKNVDLKMTAVIESVQVEYDIQMKFYDYNKVKLEIPKEALGK